MITASIVTYHTSHSELSRLIECVMKSDIETIYIIDNSTNDELRDYVTNNHRLKYIHSINLGYGSGHNIAIRNAIKLGAKYHIVLNPDVYWTDSVIEKLSFFMDSNPSCGLVMPKITYPNGSIQYLCKLLPNPFDLIIRRFIPWEKYQKKHDFYYELHWTGYDHIMEVPSLSGCFMFMRCSVLNKVHGFDERYFMYAEDLDLCRRIGEVSKTIYYPLTSVVHEYEKGSYKNKKLLVYHIKSIIKYFNKWGWFFDRQRNRINKKCNAELNRFYNNRTI